MTQYGPVGDFSIEDKIVLVTGGGSGIGFAMVKLCALHGARVLIGDLKLTPEAQTWVSKAPPPDIMFEQCDVSSWTSLRNLITLSVKTWGAVPDVYVPAAGIFEPPWSNFWDDGEDGSYKTLRINVDHPIQLTRLAMRALAGAEKQGVICLVASTAGIRGNYWAALYCASKHAIVGFTKSLGEADSEEGVKVVCICPGMVQTPLWTDRSDKAAEECKYEERAGLQPEEIAHVMVAMIERKEYGGGTVVLKTHLEERVVEEGYAERKAKESYDPSPRPEPDLSRIRGILGKERSKKWQV